MAAAPNPLDAAPSTHSLNITIRERADAVLRRGTPRVRRSHDRLDDLQPRTHHLQTHRIATLMDTLTQRITYAYNLMCSARRNGETNAEQTHADRMNALLERVPRQSRF